MNRGAEGEKKRAEWKADLWLRRFLAVMLLLLLLTGTVTAVLDPFFHYHAPLPGFYYTLSDQRYQNDGITQRFPYDAVITGTSMVENFKTSEFDTRFGTHAVKLPYPGATFREINDNLKIAFRTHDDLRIVLRGLDYSHLTEEADALRTDMGEYPDYLYDRNPFNDVRYLFNRDAAFAYVVPMIARRLTGHPGGVMSFDEYGASAADIYSAEQALRGRTAFSVDREEHSSLTEHERALVLDNIRENVTALAEAHPETTFFLFYTPYSAVWYGGLLEEGGFGKQLEAERLAAEEMLHFSNIRLFSFSADAVVTTELSHYKDAGHYSPEVADWIVERIYNGKNELTLENLNDYLAEEEKLYRELDYDALFAQANQEEE